MKLTFKSFEMELLNKRNNQDRRKKEDRYVVSYIGDDGCEYRKAFSFKCCTPFALVKQSIPVVINRD